MKKNNKRVRACWRCCFGCKRSYHFKDFEDYNLAVAYRQDQNFKKRAKLILPYSRSWIKEVFLNKCPICNELKEVDDTLCLRCEKIKADSNGEW